MAKDYVGDARRSAEEIALWNHRDNVRGIDERISSPIEQAFAYSIWACALVRGVEVVFHTWLVTPPSEYKAAYVDGRVQLRCDDRPASVPLQEAPGDPMAMGLLIAWPQCRIGSARVDFLIELRTGDGTAFLVVECDGHDFHEKTKEQARKDKERDRNLQLAGLPVFRFAGSEIYADVSKCAATCMDYLEESIARVFDAKASG